MVSLKTMETNRVTPECNQFWSSVITVLMLMLGINGLVICGNILTHLHVIMLQLSSCVEWLSFHCPKDPEILSKDIVEYVEERLDALFTTPVYQNLALRRKCGLLDQVCSSGLSYKKTKLLKVQHFFLENRNNRICKSGLDFLYNIPEAGGVT